MTGRPDPVSDVWEHALGLVDQVGAGTLLATTVAIACRPDAGACLASAWAIHDRAGDVVTPQRIGAGTPEQMRRYAALAAIRAVGLTHRALDWEIEHPPD